MLSAVATGAISLSLGMSRHLIIGDGWIESVKILKNGTYLGLLR